MANPNIANSINWDTVLKQQQVQAMMGVPYPSASSSQSVWTPPNLRPENKVKKPGFLKSLAILIAAAWLAHKIWKNRDKIEARAEKLLGKLIGKLGLGD